LCPSMCRTDKVGESEVKEKKKRGRYRLSRGVFEGCLLHGKVSRALLQRRHGQQVRVEDRAGKTSLTSGRKSDEKRGWGEGNPD